MARSLLVKVSKQLEADDGVSVAVAKRETPAKDPDGIRSLKFVRKKQKSVYKNPKKSINAIAKEPKISMLSIGRNVHEDLCSKSYVMRRPIHCPQSRKITSQNARSACRAS